MTKATSTKIKPCADCEKFHGGRYTPAPPHLESMTGTKFVSSPVGASDETYYRCRNCGLEWLHETGTAGYGWISFPNG